MLQDPRVLVFKKVSPRAFEVEAVGFAVPSVTGEKGLRVLVSGFKAMVKEKPSHLSIAYFYFLFHQ
jgi:hypothetical protein